MRRLFNNSLVFQLTIIMILNGLALSKTFAQNVSDNPSFALGNGMNYSSGTCCSDNASLFGASVPMLANDNCYSDCVDPCMNACETNCVDPCFNDCGNACYDSCGMFPFIADVANVALTPVHWVADLLTYGTYPDCGCAPKLKRAYCDPCNVCGNWAGCNYCGGQGCNSCSGAADINGMSYVGDNITTSDFDDNIIQNQQMPTPQDQMQNYEELPSNVINNQNPTSRVNRRLPQQVAMRPQQMFSKNQYNKQNIPHQNTQQQMMNVPNQRQKQMQNLQQIPQQMQPIQKQNQGQIVPANNVQQPATTTSDVQSSLNLSNNQQILVLPNLDQTNPLLQTSNNQPKIKIYNQQIPDQQRNQILQVAQQPQMNGMVNKIRPVNYNAFKKMNQGTNIQQQMIVPQKLMIPVNNNNQTPNGMVQMVIVPNNKVQQPSTLPTARIQQATKLNQTYGK